MKRITFHLDFISPYAYLAFEHLPVALEGLSYSVDYRPVLLGAVLKAHGQLGPAEIPSKRSWTYRHVLWLGHAHGIPIDMPASHPYDPLPHLRLALSTTPGADINRYVAESIFRDVWRGGGDASDSDRLASLALRLPKVRDGSDDEARAQLRSNTSEAVKSGVFGVPAFEVDERLFWGFDGLAVLRAYLAGDAWFDGPRWDEADRRSSALRGTKG